MFAGFIELDKECLFVDDDEVVFIKDSNSLVIEGTTDDYDATNLYYQLNKLMEVLKI